MGAFLAQERFICAHLIALCVIKWFDVKLGGILYYLILSNIRANVLKRDRLELALIDQRVFNIR
jgi:hypothetical protein